MPLNRFKLAKTDRVRSAISPTVEAGGAIDRELWAEQLSVSVGTVQRAEMQVRAYLEGRMEMLEELCGGKPPAELTAAPPPVDSEKMVSIHVLIEELHPLFEEIRNQSQIHQARVSQTVLGMTASKGQKLLDRWASDDPTVRRVHGRVRPQKPPAKRKTTNDKPLESRKQHDDPIDVGGSAEVLRDPCVCN